jgi:putative membrane protein
MRVGFIIGLGVVIILVGWQGFATIADRLAGAGWGIFLVALFIPPDLLLRTASFRLLFPLGRTPRFADAALAIWIGTSVNFLLPVATVGGEFVKARILTLRAVRGVDAAASVVLDKTVQALSMLLWAVIGIVILTSVATLDDPTVMAAIIGATLLALGIGGFVVVQYAGALSTIARPAARVSSAGKWRSLIEGAADLDVALRDLYRRPGAIIISTLIRLAKRVLMGGEVWLVAWLLGYPIGLGEAVMLNSLAVALRSAAFAVPGGFGVQEGGYIMLGALIGLPPDVMLAISLATRLGEVIEGLPGLAAWQYAEGGNYWRRRRNAPPANPSC